MKATELRIGNLVKVKQGICVVVAIDQQGAIIEPAGNDYRKRLESNREELEPIPLTKEWLLDFGFEKSSHWYVSKSYTFIFDSINIESGTWGISLTRGHNEMIIKTDCKYVHTLQNIYFSLCGEELTIKE